MPAIFLVLRRRLAIVAMRHLHSIISMMVMLVDRDGAGDVAYLMGVPGRRRCGHTERHRREGEHVQKDSKRGHHGDGS